MDKFKINWVERNKSHEVTSITGFQYQIDAWEKDYRKSNSNFKIKIGTKITNSDGTITVSYIKTN